MSIKSDAPEVEKHMRLAIESIVVLHHSSTRVILDVELSRLRCRFLKRQVARDSGDISGSLLDALSWSQALCALRRFCIAL